MAQVLVLPVSRRFYRSCSQGICRARSLRPAAARRHTGAVLGEGVTIPRYGGSPALCVEVGTRLERTTHCKPERNLHRLASASVSCTARQASADSTLESVTWQLTLVGRLHAVMWTALGRQRPFASAQTILALLRVCAASVGKLWSALGRVRSVAPSHPACCAACAAGHHGCMLACQAPICGACSRHNFAFGIA